jgi:hypothetical protein
MTNNYLNDARDVEADLTAFMQDIIRIPSLSSQEGAVIERIRQEMERLDFDEVTVDPMGNLIGRVGSGSRVIALDGHTDTVDVGDPSLWDRDPFSGDVEDGILYGRGTSDMKPCRKKIAMAFAGSTSRMKTAFTRSWCVSPNRRVCAFTAAIVAEWKWRYTLPGCRVMARHPSVASMQCTKWRTSSLTSRRSMNDSNHASRWARAR